MLRMSAELQWGRCYIN
uniref:Uncharacterized protein n=1 Tax=Anguilla anguilla TaxID=7936 RepID=A0A0E9RLT5_ANGAN